MKKKKIVVLLFAIMTGVGMFAQENEPVQIPYFESFLGDIGLFTVNDVYTEVGQVWKPTSYYGMKASAYLSGNHASESWLISPKIILPNTNNINMSYEQVLNYACDNMEQMQVKLSTDDGNTWINLPLSDTLIGHNWTFRHADILLNEYAGQTIRVAFVYKSTSECAPTWEIKNFSIKESPLSGQCGENLYWNLDYDSGSLSITGTGDMWDSVAYLHWHEYKAHISTVSLPEGLTAIGVEAFMNCSRMVSIQIPEGVTTIGASAFNDCASLMSINLPNSVNQLGYSVFEGCNRLTEPVYNKFIFAFMPRTYSGKYAIPDSIVSVAGYAFYNCRLLTKVILPASTEQIGILAFNECTALEKVICYAIIPPTCQDYAFIYSDFEEGARITKSALYVPEESIDAYRNADTWKEFNPILPISSEGMDLNRIGNSVTKIQRDGQILILRGEKTYTLQGQEVR